MDFTYKEATALLQDMRKIEKRGLAKTKSAELARVVEICDAFSKSMKVFVDAAKEELLANNEAGTVFYFPENERKVVINPGKEGADIDSAKFFRALKRADRLKDFAKIVHVQVKLINDNFPKDPKMAKILTSCSESKTGNPYVSAVKMSKDDLVEHKRRSA